MYNDYRDFLASITTDLLNDLIGRITGTMKTMVEVTFQVEKAGDLFGGFLTGGILTSQTLEKVYWAMYSLSMTLLLGKVLWKGFNIYVLWRRGEPETSPTAMLTGMGIAIATGAAFPLLYPILIDVILYMMETILACFKLEAYWFGSDIFSLLSDTIRTILGGGMVTVVAALIYVVMVLVLYGRMLLRSAEMMIFRIGVPLAALDLINSDDGVWRSYIQVLFQQAALSLTQGCLLIISLYLICAQSLSEDIVSSWLNGNVIMAIIFAAMALSTPKLLQRYFPVVGGGSITQKVGAITSVVKLVIR